VATTWVGTDGWLRPWTTRSATAQVETAHGGGWRGRRTPTRQGPDDDTRPPRPTGHRLAGLQGSWRGVWLPGSPSATTGSTPPTGSTQPRPISRLLGQPSREANGTPPQRSGAARLPPCQLLVNPSRPTATGFYQDAASPEADREGASNYESVRTHPAGAIPAGSGCSRRRARPARSFLTCGVTAGK
jgi:hypothetical protein